MAGWVGPILAVRLLGRASIYLMAPVSQAFQLAWTNRTMSLARGQMGSLCVARIRTAECPARPSVQRLAPPDDSRGRKLEAVAASVAVLVIALLMFFAALGWAGRSRLCREASESPVRAGQRGIGRVCPTRCADRTGSAAGPGPDAATAMQHSTAEVPASSVATTSSITSLARSARPGAARACHMRHPQNIPAIPTAGTARLAGFIPLIRM
jgi:hypothetical protein